MKKALRLIIAFAAMLALTLSSAIGGSSPATAAAPAQPDQQLVVAAANPASAFPKVKTSLKCSMLPAPPLAIMGMDNSLDILANASLAKPCFTPS